MSLTNWLTTQDLAHFVDEFADEKTNAAFLGVFPINRLPQRLPNLPVLFILNTNTDNLPGQHWKAVYVSQKGEGEVFDSLASTVSLVLQHWMNTFTKKWTVSTLTLQNPLSPSCGAYVLYYVLTRLKHVSFDSFNAMFSNNVLDNDKRMEYFMNSLV